MIIFLQTSNIERFQHVLHQHTFFDQRICGRKWCVRAAEASEGISDKTENISEGTAVGC